MDIQIVTNEASYFQTLHTLCRQVHPSVRLSHYSEEHWKASADSLARAGAVVVAQPSFASTGEPMENKEKVFAVMGTVGLNHCNSIQWVSVSRNDFVLWLREKSSMTTDATILEDVVVQSAHVRLAQFRIPTCCRLIPALRDRLMKGLQDFRVVQGSRENHFCMALEEALNNAFYHGNLEISSELKEDGSSRFIELAAERELLSPWSRRHVLVTELVSPFGIWITIRDEGNGFNVKAALERCNDPEALLASGRGLLLMRGFSDDLFFNSTGNEVTLVLYGDAQDRELPLGVRNSSELVALVPTLS